MHDILACYIKMKVSGKTNGTASVRKNIGVSNGMWQGTTPPHEPYGLQSW